MKEKPVKNALPDQNNVSGKSDVKNRETRKAIADAIAGKGLSRTYDSIEEMFDDLAEHALYQYEQGNCVEIREFARKNKIKVSK
jgi:hypothetical protein